MSNNIYVTHKSKELMGKLRSAVVKEFIRNCIYLHNNPDETYSLEVNGEHDHVLTEDKHNDMKAFVEKFMIDNDNSINVKKPKSSKKKKNNPEEPQKEILA